ncbi:hypothetical protein LTR85_011409 [Meristemomyces frigidus]|nr:hypothetical protein LTR85_011409 [Meristemomyces frigidus]
MPRRQFVADLQKAQEGTLPLGIINLQQGEDDGQFDFDFVGDFGAEFPEAVKVTAMIQDVSEYPKSHEYMIFCGDDAPRHIGAALQNVRGTDRKTVYELIDIISATLTKLSPDRDGDMQMEDSQQYDEDQLEDEDEDDIYDSDHEAFEFGPKQHTTPYAQPSAGAKLKPADRTIQRRIRSDLLAAKNAGFKVGHLGGLMDGYNSFVTVSIRMSKLGISEEAMQAWQVTPADYLILLIQYPNGYKSNEELQGFDSLRLAPNIGFRVCAGRRYKPTLEEAIKAFTIVKKNERESVGTSDLPAPEDDTDESSVRETFISRPLNSLLQERLVPVVRYRSSGMDWRGAEDWFSEVTSKGASGADAVPDKYFEPEPTHDGLPNLVKADHYAVNGLMQHSFPLLAMQFLLRHFVRCTDFCLVCHRHLDTELEAIKPYVCDQPLCLYQYLSIGFGPSIEHEIIAQPYVVDLLVSFCYNSAACRKLRDFPDGLALMVPPVDPSQYNVIDPYAAARYGRNPAVPEKKDPKLTSESNLPVYEIGFDRERLEILFFDKPDTCPVKRGNWIVLKVAGTLEGAELHCRVVETTYYPSIKVDEPVVLRHPSANTDQQTPAAAGKALAPPAPPKTITPATTPKWANASFQVYEQDFEQLDRGAKCLAICKLLDTLPNVKQMQEFLARRHPADLKHWVERISPAALSLLRWIIASNRACIMQVDGDRSASSKPQERLYGMTGYIQFRFAMGAPDKEQRFITEVRKTTTRLALKYPTIFAFHGSPLHNWHMIIREGLHFKNADHGRAYGDGVYHAKDAQTSTGYSGMNYYNPGQGGSGMKQGVWPNSVLKINSALALNELVNAPAEFQSSNPYYVVQRLEYIQTRFLFVQCTPDDENLKSDREKKPANPHPQDPQLTPRGISDSIVIPASAITSGRAAKDTARTVGKIRGQSPLKKMKGLGGFNDPINLDGDDDADSVVTDAEDLDILFEEEEPEPEPVRIDSHAFGGNRQVSKRRIGASQTGTSQSGTSQTDYVPGELDFSKLPLMPVPTYAVSATTKRLLKELQSLQKMQDTIPLADLGWYIDVDKIENVYQWPVELHSFSKIDSKLPLIAGLQKQDLKSIVLEIRFNKSFPFEPPYVRVIRPRFLSFAQGGGGHIVMGGAMCMELLTNSGWSSVSSMESVLLQIRLAIALSDPPAKVDPNSRGADYGTGEAADGYIRACNTHGWAVPPGFKEMAYGSSSADCAA